MKKAPQVSTVKFDSEEELSIEKINAIIDNINRINGIVAYEESRKNNEFTIVQTSE